MIPYAASDTDDAEAIVPWTNIGLIVRRGCSGSWCRGVRRTPGRLASTCRCGFDNGDENMQIGIGSIVRVRTTGRRARIIEDLGLSHYRVLFYADPAADALDQAMPQDEDDAGGVYSAADLEVV
jgi:hypothetical protein